MRHRFKPTPLHSSHWTTEPCWPLVTLVPAVANNMAALLSPLPPYRLFSPVWQQHHLHLCAYVRQSQALGDITSVLLPEALLSDSSLQVASSQVCDSRDLLSLRRHCLLCFPSPTPSHSFYHLVAQWGAVKAVDGVSCTRVGRKK